jgi:glycosyltransferase involved in cell wall biosynthesis
MTRFSKDASVLIATFSPWKNDKRLPINGNLEPMLDYFVPKVKRVVLIDQVYPGSDFVMPRIEVYENHSLQKIKRVSFWLYTLYPVLRLVNKGGTHLVFKLRDLLSVIDQGMQTHSPFAYFIGFEAINAIAGVFLRRIGKVKKVIYYVSDYSPNRYKQAWFNALYLLLDRYAVTHADVVWDVSPVMQPARIKAGLDQKKSAPVIVVPNALYPKQIAYTPIEQCQPYSLVFMGTLGIENGPDIAIKSMPAVLKKFPKATLHIVGGGHDEVRLKQLVKKLHISDAVIFHGFISDREKVSEAIRNYMIALAPYCNIPGSARLYGDATKIRAYLAAGLPTITTKVPPLGKIAQKFGAAIVVNDTHDAISESVIKLFSDKEAYAAMKKKAIAFAKDNTWENEFDKAFDEMETK